MRKDGLIVLGCFLCVFCVAIFMRGSAANTVSEDENDEIPVINISLDGVSLDEINNNSKDIKYYGNEVSVDGEVFNNVEIKGRGNFTWNDEKKPYQIRFAQRTSFLGLSKNRKFALLSNNSDDTHIRNSLALKIIKMLDENYPIGGRFAEVLVDNEYLGLYYVTNVVRINKGTLKLKDELGILMEMDNIYCNEELSYVTDGGDCLTVKDLVVDDNAVLAAEDFMDDFNEMEKAIKKQDFVRFAELADVESFVNYYLVSEFSANPDAYSTSFFFYKDGKDDKIHAGPAWDFDFAFGNKRYGAGAVGEILYSPTEMMVGKKNAFGWKYYDENDGRIKEVEANLIVSRLMYYLIDMPEFREMVGRIYEEKMKGKMEEVLEYIDSVDSKICLAARRNNEKWNRGDFDVEVGYLKSWVEKRFDYFNEVYGRWDDLVNEKKQRI